jgi:hypothetical protein
MIVMPQIQSIESLEQLLSRHGCLSGPVLAELPDGFSPVTNLPVDDPAQPRCFWCPAGLPAGRSVFLASSRLDQKLEDKPAWFDALRTFACHAKSNDYILITADGTTSDEFVTRIAELFKIPLVRFVPFPTRIDGTWISQAAAPRLAGEHRCYYYPGSRSGRNRKTAQAEKDRLLMLIASQVRVLACRKSGNTFASVSERLAAGLDTRILLEGDLTSAQNAACLVNAGATAWLLIHDCPHRTHPAVRTLDIPLVQLNEIPVERYLLHWTRRRVGQWPDQSRKQYLDDLIFGSTRAQHDPLAALCRILATDRIIATSNLTRDPTPVVCLSEVPLSRLDEMTVFRNHLSRWDFLPFGIAVDKERLSSLGARPVVYGSQTDWDTMAPADRPFFQQANSESGKIDWRQEREWRLVGELDLRQLANDEAVVFVPTIEDAQTVSSLSRWPVVVLANDPSG